MTNEVSLKQNFALFPYVPIFRTFGSLAKDKCGYLRTFERRILFEKIEMIEYREWISSIVLFNE